MSWDLLAMSCTSAPARVAELPDNWTPDAVLGAAAELRARISFEFPATDWTDPTFGLYDDADFALEFGLGDDDPVVCAAVHVRGSGDSVVERLLAFGAAHTWYFLDTTQNEWLHHVADPHVGWNAFQKARDAIAKKVDPA